MTNTKFPSSSTPVISWVPPQPRSGAFSGGLDGFIGPGATTAELILQFGGAALVAVILTFNDYYTNNATMSVSQLAVTSLLAIDMIGGVVTNATSAAKRWFHRDSQTTKDHLLFVAIHAFQIGIVATTAAQDPKLFFAAVYGFIMLASIVIVMVPLYLQRPVAMLLTTVSIPLSLQLQQAQIGPPLGTMEWFVPILSIKLLVSHLTKEAPFQPEAATATNKLH